MGLASLWNGNRRAKRLCLRRPSEAGSFPGIGVSEINANRAKALKVKEERGVEITRVEEDRPLTWCLNMADIE